MLIRKLWATLLVAIGMVAIASASHYRFTRPQMLCAIPDRDYQFKQYSQPKRSLSAVGIPIQVATNNGAPQGRRIQAFQFVDTPVLTTDHCSLSKMSVLLHETGRWSVSFQADQNPVNIAPLRDVTTAKPKTKATSHLLRNEFQVRVTCYGGRSFAKDTKISRPVLVPLDPHSFWVQRGVPYPYLASGNDARIEDYFDLIDRVEIEFVYRR